MSESRAALKQKEAQELAARQKLVRLERELRKAGQVRAARQIGEKNRGIGEAMRAEMRNSELGRLLHGIAPAREEDLYDLAVSFNTRMREVFAEPSWIKLFRAVDTDGSGQISFNEILNLARDELNLLPSDVSDESIKAFWLALDTDRSGFISCGEFGAFMRRGEHVLRSQTSWKAKLEAKNRMAALRVRESNHSRWPRGLDGVGPADEETVEGLARMCNRQLLAARRTVDVDASDEEASRSLARTWFGLFKRIDVDSSGQICFEEFTRLIRVDLGVPEEAMGKAGLKSVWLCLDVDGSGFISAGEWAGFMRRGEDHRADVERRAAEQDAFRERVAAARRQEQLAKRRVQMAQQMSAEERRLTVKAKRETKRRQLLAAATEMESTKREAARKVRAETDLSEVRHMLRDTTAASEEEIVQLAEACNAKLLPEKPTFQPSTHRDTSVLRPPLESEDSGIRSWYQLFKSVDTDNSGQISYSEFSTLLRHDLQLARLGFTEEGVRQVWMSIDADASGFISCGEFGKFMRKGQHVKANGVEGRVKPSWREQRAMMAARAHAQRQADKTALYHGSLQKLLESTQPASASDVQRMSIHLNARLVELQEVARADESGAVGGVAQALFGGSSGGWYTLFKHVDMNSNGSISYVEFRTLVRDTLALPASNVPEVTLRAVWRALDKEHSGLLSAGDFMIFMKAGAASTKRVNTLEMRRQLAEHARSKVDQQHVRLKKGQLREVDGRTKDIEERARRLEQELASVESELATLHASVPHGHGPPQPIDAAASGAMPHAATSPGSAELLAALPGRGAPDPARRTVEPAMRVRTSVDGPKADLSQGGRYRLTKALEEEEYNARKRLTQTHLSSAYSTPSLLSPQQPMAGYRSRSSADKKSKGGGAGSPLKKTMAPSASESFLPVLSPSPSKR